LAGKECRREAVVDGLKSVSILPRRCPARLASVQVLRADITFDTKDPTVRRLVVIPKLDSSEPSEHARIVALVRGVSYAATIGLSGCDTQEAAGIESGPVGRPNVSMRRRLGLHGHHRSDHLRRELISKTGVAGPAIDVVAVPIVDAHEAKPAGV